MEYSEQLFGYVATHLINYGSFRHTFEVEQLYNYYFMQA